MDADCPAGFACIDRVCCWLGEHVLDGGLDGGPVPDAGKLPKEIGWKPLRPNVMLVIDRSGSMVEPTDESCQCDNPNSQPTCCTKSQQCFSPFDPSSPNDCKWKDLLTVITDPKTGLVPTHETTIRFGLTIFPSNLTCGEGSVYVEPAEGNAASITSALQQGGPGGGTPTANTLEMLTTDPVLADPLRSEFALLITDGQPNCNAANAAKCQSCTQNPSICDGPVNTNGTSTFCNPPALPPFATCDIAGTPGGQCLDGDGTVAAIADLRKLNILTIVLGLGSEAASPNAFTVLNAAAVAGGAANPAGPPSFYPAANAADLAKFLSAIAAAVPQCKFQLEADVPPGMLHAFLDQAPVPADPQNGYVYDESVLLVTFEGATCRIASDGQTHTIDFQAY